MAQIVPYPKIKTLYISTLSNHNKILNNLLTKVSLTKRHQGWKINYQVELGFPRLWMQLRIRAGIRNQSVEQIGLKVQQKSYMRKLQEYKESSNRPVKFRKYRNRSKSWTNTEVFQKQQKSMVSTIQNQIDNFSKRDLN